MLFYVLIATNIDSFCQWYKTAQFFFAALVVFLDSWMVCTPGQSKVSRSSYPGLVFRSLSATANIYSSPSQVTLSNPSTATTQRGFLHSSTGCKIWANRWENLWGTLHTCNLGELFTHACFTCSSMHASHAAKGAFAACEACFLFSYFRFFFFALFGQCKHVIMLAGAGAFKRTA